MPNRNETHKMHRSRMRERIISSGSENLCDHELLEVLLYYSIPRKDTNALAHALIDHFGSIDKLFRASETELVSVPGIGEYSAVLLKTVFELHSRLNTASAKDKVFGTFEEIGEYFVKLFAGCDVEKCVLILFDKKGRIDRKVVRTLRDEISQRLTKLKPEIEEMEKYIREDIANENLRDEDIFRINEKIKDLEKQIANVVEG